MRRSLLLCAFLLLLGCHFVVAQEKRIIKGAVQDPAGAPSKELPYRKKVRVTAPLQMQKAVLPSRLRQLPPSYFPTLVLPARK